MSLARTRVTYSILGSVVGMMLLGSIFYTPMRTQERFLRPSESLVRNASWDSQALESVPYRAGDTLEYTYVFSQAGANIWSLDLAKLREVLDISEMHIDGQTGSVDVSRVPFHDAFSLQIRGRAKRPSSEALSGSLIQATFQPQLPEKDLTPDRLVTVVEPKVQLQGSVFLAHVANVLILQWEHLDVIDRVMIGEKAFSGVIRDGKYYIQIEKNTFASGDYFVGLYLKNGILKSLDQKISFSLDANPINITALTPRAVSTRTDTYIVIQGNGFQKLVSLQLSNNVVFRTPSYSVITDQVLSVKIPAGLPQGSYFFNLMDTKGIYEARAHTLTVTP